MIWHPKRGQRVTLRYRKEQRQSCPHMATGVVLWSATGKIVNALILLDDGRRMVVPRGNLFLIRSEA